jgi:GNAT superfamily N-acetyltransferase
VNSAADPVLIIDRATDRAGVRDWHAVDFVVKEHEWVDLPTDPVEDAYPLLETPGKDELNDFWVGRLAGRPVVAGRIRMPLLDNLDAATIEVRVLPDHRRRGYGRAMLQALVERLGALGRSTILAESPQAPDDAPPSAGDELLTAAGWRPVLAECRQLLTISAVGQNRTNADIADLEVIAAGYRTQSWVGSAPAELLDDLARLAAGMSTDAPLGELPWEPENWSAQRYRDSENMAAARGRLRITTAAIEVTSGRVVGVSSIGVSGFGPEVAWQGETIVAAAHRGHRLGLLLKLVNLRQLIDAVPAARVVMTWNARDNAHMLAINEQLGFRVVDLWREWEFTLA